MLGAAATTVMRRPNRASIVGFLALATLLIGACRQIAGIEDQPPFQNAGDGGKPNTCGALSFGNASCEACMASSCCAETTGCAGAVGCGDLVSCLGACDPHDAGCASGCRARFSAGDRGEAASVRSCEALRCTVDCQVVCGGYVYGSEACAACGVAHCCGATTACMNDRECASLVSCERGCAGTDYDCLSLCELASPDGVALERAVGACAGASCASSCVAPRWACLPSHVTLVPPPPVTANYVFSDYVSVQPIAGLTVRACRSADLPCATAQAGPATTDANGAVALQLPRGFDGYTEITGTDYGRLLLFTPTLSHDRSFYLTLPTQATILMFSRAIATPDPASGVVAVLAADCDNAPAPGVRFTLAPSEGATPYYFSRGIPSATATATDDEINGLSGGGFVNVKSNTALHLGAIVVENGLAFPESVFFTRPGGTSIVLTYASPP